MTTIYFRRSPPELLYYSCHWYGRAGLRGCDTSIAWVPQEADSVLACGAEGRGEGGQFPMQMGAVRCSRVSGAEGGTKGWEEGHTFPCLLSKRDLSSFVHVSCSCVSGGWGERGSEEGTFMCPGGGRTGWRQRVPLTCLVLVRVLRGGGRGGKWGLTHLQPPMRMRGGVPARSVCTSYSRVSEAEGGAKGGKRTHTFPRLCKRRRGSVGVCSSSLFAMREGAGGNGRRRGRGPAHSVSCDLFRLKEGKRGGGGGIPFCTPCVSHLCVLFANREWGWRQKGGRIGGE